VPGYPVARNIKAGDIEACLTELFCSRGIPEQFRLDNGSEFIAKSDLLQVRGINVLEKLKRVRREINAFFTYGPICDAYNDFYLANSG